MHYFAGIILHWFCVEGHRTEDALNSWLGHRIEVGATGVAMVIVSFAVARCIGKGVDIPYHQLSGAKLKNVHDAEKRIARLTKLRAHRFRFLSKLGRSLILFTIFAFALPSLIMASGIYYYDWFIPHGAALAQKAGCDLRSAAHPSPYTLFLFVLSQFMMGFGHSVELLIPQSHAIATAGALSPASGAVGLALTVYRYFVAGFTVVFLSYVRKIVSVFRSITPEENDLVPRN